LAARTKEGTDPNQLKAARFEWDASDSSQLYGYPAVKAGKIIPSKDVYGRAWV